MSWSDPVPDAVVFKRAAGRRHYNAVRQFRAKLRQRHVAQMLLERIPQAEIARRLGVHRATITRDVAALRGAAIERGLCPCCGQRLNAMGVALMKLAHDDTLAHRGQ